MAFIASFLQYFIIFVILVALAVGACFLGISLRKRKDAKRANASAKEQK